MARWAWILITVGALLVSASEAGAQGFTSPFGNGSDRADSKPQKGSEGFSPMQETGTGSTSPEASFSDPVPSVMALTTNTYKIGPQDVIEISVFSVPELSKTLQVADTGTINYPLLGEIPAAGKTPTQLERELTSKLGAKYLQSPIVTVFVKEYNSQRVTVSGAVQKPGVYPIRTQTSLLQLIALAGGLQEKSDSTVLVMRQTGAKRMAARFDLSSIEVGRAEDPILQSNDVVVAGTSIIKQTWGQFLRALPVVGTFAIF